MAQYINRRAPGSGLATLMASRGRGGDTELVHMTRPEVKRLEATGLMSLNPQTGLPEYFLGGLKNFAKSLMKPRNLAAMAAGIMFGPAIYGAIGGSALGTALGTGLFGTVATGALSGAAVGGLTGAIAGRDIPKSIMYGGLTGGAGAGLGYGKRYMADHARKQSWEGEQIQTAWQQQERLKGLAPKRVAKVTGVNVDNLGTPLERIDAIYNTSQDPDLAQNLKKLAINPDNLVPREMAMKMAVRPDPNLIREHMGAGDIETATNLLDREEIFASPAEIHRADIGTDFFSARTPIQSMKNVLPYYQQRPSKLLPISSQIIATTGLVEADEAAEELQKKQAEAMLAGSRREVYEQKDREYTAPFTINPPDYEDILARYYGGVQPGGWEGRWYGPISGDDIYAKEGGLISLEKGGRAFEGQVRGTGHGMQDNVMMPINGGGIAAVSPKEYVVPADVMAMLGNGNADDGSEKMDRFISKFRKTKYGRDTQPPEMDGSTALQSLVRA